MQKLIDGVHYFQNVGFRQQQELFERLAGGQNPEACFITCSDSRIDPNLITNAKPGQLFIVRNAGNVIPCYGTSNNGELAAVEFAVGVLGVKDIIVCGHTHCGAMKGVLNPQSLDSLPTLKRWLSHCDSTAEIIKDHYSHLSGEELYTATAEENVLVQLEHLRTLPIIASRASRGIINLHGWMYKFETGEVFVYDSAIGQFAKLGEDNGLGIK
ncbi:carbonic anhydrase [Armatimonas sp.]|uniref:carbonic anhydrase n=1 Tax=Armatimonas sp. TaxID=1872638 RepID=UPI00286C21F4|nr:carbonic anhydrase [Armatimonas sp.]